MCFILVYDRTDFQSLSLKQGYKHTPSNMTRHRDQDAV
jgi:hypothetical protein